MQVKGTRGPSQFVDVPSLTPELAYISGVLYGDGHLVKNRKHLVLSISDLPYTKDVVKPLFKTLFGIDVRVVKKNEKRLGRLDHWRIEFTNKFVYSLFNTVFEIPSGKKSALLRIPKVIVHAPLDIKMAFIAGLFDTDGGLRKKGVRVTMSNPNFQKGVGELFSEFGMTPHFDKWFNRNTLRWYYGVWLNKRESIQFINSFPLKIQSKWTYPVRGCRSGQTSKTGRRSGDVQCQA